MTATPWTSSELVRTRQALRALALRLVADADAADDVVQDAYAALAARGEPPATPERWLARVTRNLALRWRRDRVRRQRREVAGVRGEATPDALTLAAQVELQRDLADAVLALAEPYRATLLQRFWEDKSPRAIAEATDTPVATVKARLQRGLALVRSALDRRYGDRATWRAALVPMLGAGGTLAVGGVGVSAGWKIAAGGIVAVGLSVAWAASRPAAPAGANGAAAVMAASSSARGGEAAGTVPSTEPTSTTSTRTLVDALGEYLEVEVVGADGLPAADIGVGLRGLYYERDQGKWWENYCSLGRTDGQGRLCVDPARMSASTAGDDWWRQLGDPHARVYIDEPGFVGIATEPMTRAELNRARVRLEMPAGGSLRIVSTDALGRLMVREDGGLQLNEEAADSDATRERPARSASWWRHGDGTGTTTFARVGLGALLSITSSWAGNVRCPPLVRPGEERVVLAGVVDGFPILTGRLVDAAGRVLARTQFGVFARAGLGCSTPSALTHADGSFAVGIGGPEFLRRRLLELYVRTAAGTAYPTVAGQLEARTYDLGDVVLRPAPLIVSGRLSMPESASTASPYLDVERLEHVKYLDGTEQDVWRRVERAGLRRDGVAFAFFGEIDGGRLRVNARGSGAGHLPPAPIEFPLGATELLVAFRAGGVLRVSFTGPTCAGLHVSLEPAAGVVPPFSGSTFDAPSRFGNEYAYSGLWPGRYRLLAQVLGDATPTLFVDGIDVAEGQTKTLGPLSLPAPIRELTVRIEDETGKPLRLSALVVHPTRGEQATVLLAPEGEVNVPTTTASVDVVATAAGRRAVRLQLAADTTVRLAPATTRSVALEGTIPALPQDVEFALEVHVSGADANLREQSDSRRTACVGLQSRRKLALDAAGRGSLEVAQAGRYRIVPVLLTLKTRFYYRVEIEGAAVELVVGERDLDAAAAIAVTLPEAGLQKALARVGELLSR